MSTKKKKTAEAEAPAAEDTTTGAETDLDEAAPEAPAASPAPCAAKAPAPAAPAPKIRAYLVTPAKDLKSVIALTGKLFVYPDPEGTKTQTITPEQYAKLQAEPAFIKATAPRSRKNGVPMLVVNPLT